MQMEQAGDGTVGSSAIVNQLNQGACSILKLARIQEQVGGLDICYSQVSLLQLQQSLQPKVIATQNRA